MSDSTSLIVPAPAKVRLGAGSFDLRRCDAIICDNAWRSVGHALAQSLAMPIPLADAGRRPVHIRKLDSWPRGSKVTDEGYRLSVTPDRITIEAMTARGASYGAHTLRQLVTTGRVAATEITDSPALPVRGAHLYVPPRKDIDYFERLIAYLASCKMNTIVLEVGAAIESRRHPRINQAWRETCQYVNDYPWGQNQFANANRLNGRGKDSFHLENGGGDCITQDDLRRILDCARRHHIEVIPELQSLSHSYWLCLAYPHIAERAGDPYPCTYCPSNEDSYKLLFDVAEEWLELFQPRKVHIGHDEWYFRNICPRCRRRKTYDILADDVNRIHAFFHDRGVQCIMWADQLINPDKLKVKRLKEWGTGKMIRYGGGLRHITEGKGVYTMQPCHQALRRIPRDVVLADWYYVLSPDTAAYLGNDGRDVLLGNFSPSYLDRQPQPLRAPTLQGGFISTWVEASLRGHGHDNWPMLAAVTADMLWRGQRRKGEAAKRLPDCQRFWSDQRDRLVPPHAAQPSRSGTLCRYEPLNLGGPHAKSTPSYHVRLRVLRQPMRIAADVVEPVMIPVGGKVKSIVMLMKAMDVDKMPPRVALYQYSNYDYYFRLTELVSANIVGLGSRGNQSSGPVPLRINMEIGAGDGPMDFSPGHRPTFADPVDLADGKRAYAFEWVHPDPQHLPIHHIELRPGPGIGGASVYLYAVTLIR